MGEKFDVVLGLEVAEHLEEEFADVYVENLINLAKDDGVILFSAAIPFQGGNNHVNEQWQTYWVAKFYNRGYWGIMYENLRRDKRPSLWYRQNLMVFRKHAKSKGGVAAEDYVLPEYYLEICKHLKG
jgi:hypothetical protein